MDIESLAGAGAADDDIEEQGGLDEQEVADKLGTDGEDEPEPKEDKPREGEHPEHDDDEDKDDEDKDPDAVEEKPEGETETPATEVQADPELEAVIVADDVQAKAAEAYAANEQKILDNIAREYVPEVTQLAAAEKQLIAQAEAIAKARKDEGDREATSDEILALTEIRGELKSILLRKSQIKTEYAERIRKDTFEHKVQANIELRPQFKKYEAEYRELLEMGVERDAPVMLAMCKTLYAQKGKPPIQAAPTKAEREEKVLERNIANKRRATITAGAGSAGIGQKAGGPSPRMAKDLADISSLFKKARGV